MSQDGFTVKDKAKDLIEKFGAELAVKCCDEICNYEYFGSHTQNYWSGVKKEIEKIEREKKA